MTTRYTFTDDSDDVRLSGFLTPDPGGFTPARNVGQCSLDFTNISSGAISFTFGQGDATLVSLTNPLQPKPVIAGTYAYTLYVSQNGGGDGGTFVAKLIVDDDYYSIPAPQGVLGPTAGLSSWKDAVVSVVWFSDALSPFSATITDASADTYIGSLYVQRIT